MGWNAGNTGRSTAACGLLANAISCGARVTVLQETPSDSIAIARASYRGATTTSGGMNTLTTTCTSAMIRATKSVFSERDYGLGNLYRAWIDINGERLEQCFPKHEEGGQPRRKKQFNKGRSKGRENEDRDSGPNTDQHADPNDRFRHNDTITACCQFPEGRT